METFLALDRAIFQAINHLPHFVLSDSIALTLSGFGTGGVIWFLVAIWMFVREEHKDHWFFIPIISSGFVSWLLAEVIFKPFVARPRPANFMSTWLVIPDPISYSFPSSHATIAFAMAYVLSQYEPKLRWVLYSLATLIASSRVYLGVHYPSDVVAGAILGVAIGYGILAVKKFPQKTKRLRQEPRGKYRKR